MLDKKVDLTICRKSLIISCSISSTRDFKNLAVVKLKLLKVNLKSHHLLYKLILYFLKCEYTLMTTLGSLSANTKMILPGKHTYTGFSECGIHRYTVSTTGIM